MASPIRRLVQLILDKAAAKRMEDDARSAIGGVESRLGALRKFATDLGAAFAAAFGVRAMIRFGEESVKQAADAEDAWSDLAGTVANAGVEFKSIEKDVRALGGAFQDATTHTDDDFNASLSRLITISGDVSASIQNMGLVANVAAQFFKGDLAAATDLVGKVMQGNTTLLNRMGISVKTAQEGLNILAERSFGAATRESGRFSGQLKVINNLWEDFKQGLGEAIVGNGKATSSLNLVRDALKDLVKWVQDNRDGLRQFATEGIQFAISSMQTLLGLMRDYLQMRGTLSFTSGTAAPVLGGAAKTPEKEAAALQAQLAAFARQRIQLESDRAAALAALEGAQNKKSILGMIPILGAIPLALDEVKKLRLDQDLKSVISQLETVDKNAANAQERLANIGKPKEKPVDLFGNPKTSKNAKADELDDVGKALKAYEENIRAAHKMEEILGEDFDLNAARASALTTVIGVLASQPVLSKENQARLKDFGEQLHDITAVAGETEALQTFRDAMHQANIQLQTQGDQFDFNAAKAAALQSVIASLANQKALTPEGRQALRDYAEALKNLLTYAQLVDESQKAYEKTLRTVQAQQVIANESFDDAGKPLDTITTSLQALSTESQSLSQIIQTLIEDGFERGDPVLEGFIDKLRMVNKVTKDTNKALNDQKAIAQAVGEALDAALTGGIGPYAAMKAKQNLIQAAEYTVEGIAASLNPLTAVRAGPLFALAGKSAVIAAEWGALAAVTGGFGGGGGGGGAGSLGSAEGSSAGASASAKPADTEVNIFLDGPGFDALNVRVQKIVFGAEQNARERWGKNAIVRVNGRTSS